MINRLAKYILRDKLSSLNGQIEDLREDSLILRKDCEGMKDIKLRLRIAEMYIDDDEAIDELLAEEKSSALDSLTHLYRQADIASQSSAMAAARTQGAQGYYGQSAFNQQAYNGHPGQFGGRFI